jgi:hypothetical protein
VLDAERIYGIIYHISSSPYYNEDIHTDYPEKGLIHYNYGVRGNPYIVRTYTVIRVSLEGVMTQG